MEEFLGNQIFFGIWSHSTIAKQSVVPQQQKIGDNGETE